MKTDENVMPTDISSNPTQTTDIIKDAAVFLLLDSPTVQIRSQETLKVLDKNKSTNQKANSCFVGTS